MLPNLGGVLSIIIYLGVASFMLRCRQGVTGSEESDIDMLGQ